jgi:hypothetical protein
MPVVVPAVATPVVSVASCSLKNSEKSRFYRDFFVFASFSARFCTVFHVKNRKL